MAHIVVLGGGIGGVSCAYELKNTVRKEDNITLVSDKPFFQFTPSNPWVAVKWRTKENITIDLTKVLPKHGIDFNDAGAARVHPAENRVDLGDGSSLTYDYLVIATGPELAFDEVEGLGPAHNTQSICDVDHATVANERWEEFCKDPGPIVVGAVQGASCYGPAYEFAMIMDADLRRRRIRDKVPMTFVTPSPMSAISASVASATPRACSNPRCASATSNGSPTPRSTRSNPASCHATEVDEDGKPKKTHQVPFKFSMMLPAFRGIPALRGVEGLTNPRGFVIVDKHQSNPKFPNIFGVGVVHRHSSARANACAGRRAQDRVHDRVHGDGHGAEYRAASSRRGAEPRSDLERDLSRRFRRFRRGVRRHPAKSAAQRQLGLERTLGPRSPRSRSRNTSCTRSGPATPSLTIEKAVLKLLDIAKIKSPAA